MKLTEDKPFQLKQVKGTIVDTRNQASWNFTEKNIIHIELEHGNKKLFYEANDEFKQNQKLRELIEKKIKKLEKRAEEHHGVGKWYLNEWKEILEKSKK